MTKKILITIALVTILAISAMAAGHQKPVFHHLRMLKDNVELTEKQEENIKNIIIEAHKGAIDLRANLEKKELEMKALMMEDKPDRAKVVKLAREIGNAKTELQINRINSQLDIREELTAEQREAMKEVWESEGGKGGRKNKGPAEPQRPRPQRDHMRKE